MKADARPTASFPRDDLLAALVRYGLDRRRTAAQPAPDQKLPTLGAVFFLFGLGTKQQHLGLGETRTCPRCHNTTQWARMREFRQFTVFFVPVARWKRRQFESCGICGAVTA